ncbi:hypothetical protein Noda2021_04170 [Candidatus Dependentiae bacterium Noda2021]|nr:hypothetical protein Noda2021_04170 [Candidatus Dependentiae bacterium Noda2021]
MFAALYGWLGSFLHSRYAELILGLVFYLEAILLLPVEPMLMVYCHERKDKAWWYATIATISSVLGALTSYAMGYLLWVHAGHQIIYNPYVAYVIKPETFTYLCSLYKKYEWAALLLAGIPPIPFKAATLTAGFCRLSLIPFVMCAFIVRGIRFYGVAYVTTQYGSSLIAFVKKYRYQCMVAGAAIISAVVWRIAVCYLF